MRWSFITNGNFIDFVHTDETSLAIESIIVSLHNTSKCIDWKLPTDTTRISFTIDEVRYEDILITDIDFDGVVMDSQDDFETGVVAMFPGLAGGSPGGSSYLSKTYAELQALIGSSGLTIGQQYLITDFATKHYIVDGNGSKPAGNPTITGVTEPLIVTAVAIDAVDKIAKSTLYPQDIIYVDFVESNWTDDISFSDSGVIVSGWKGTIYFRHDTLLDNSCGYDFRNVKFRRWKTDVAAYDGGTSYSQGDFVTSSNTIYRSLQNTNIGNTPASNSAYWVRLINLASNEYWLNKPTSQNGITASASFADFLTFVDNGLTTYDVGVRGTHFLRFLDNNTDYFYTGTLLPNNVMFLQDEETFVCYSNVFRGVCFGNTFWTGNNCYNNSIWPEFNNNILLEEFESNIIGSHFTGNVCNTFHDNVCGDNMSSNFLGIFTSNKVGASFGNNTMGRVTSNNSFGSAFRANYAGNGFQMNTIEDFFNGDNNGVDFTSATHVYASYNCNLFIRQDGTKKLSYTDNSDVLTVVNANA
jgi:hypothetical protein